MSKPLSLLRTSEIAHLVALIDKGQLQDAEFDVQALLSRYPDAGILWKILGVARLRQGKDAIAALRNAASYLPGDAEAQGNLGSALHDQGLWEEALPSLQSALRLRPHATDVLTDTADTLRALGRTTDAVPLYQRALRRGPELIEARNNLGNALLELRRYEDAIECYRRVLSTTPKAAAVHCNLANALRQLGRFDEALVSSQEAIELDPSLPVAHNNLGLVLAGLGRRDEAVASYRQALILNPVYVEAFNNVGDVLRDLGARRDAWTYYTRAIDLDPDRAESYCGLGTLLLELRRFDEAADCCARALALQPRNTMAQLSLAAARRGQGRAADAEACCQAVLSLAPQSVEARSLLGELYADQGRFSEAEGLFQQAIMLDPSFPFPRFSIAANRKMTTQDQDWLQGTEALLDKPLTLRNEISLRYALGKYFDDVKEYDQAFGHYRQANELTRRYGVEYDAERVVRQVDDIMRSFDTATIRRLQEHGNDSTRPVFIVGMPRSGTTLTEQILASHPAVFGAGELAFWQTALASFQSSSAASPGSDASRIPGIANNYLANLLLLSRDADRVIDKMPQNFKNVGLIHAAFPNAKIIHIRRHPIDTCLSIYFHYFSHLHPYSHDLDSLAHYYKQYVRLTDHWRAVLPASALLEVPYEALTSNQELWSRRMVDFIGLPWDPKCLDFHETNRVVITLSKWQVRQKMHAGSTDRWKHYEQFVGPLLRLIA